MTHHTHTILHMSALIAHINICVMYSRRIVYNIHTLAATYNKTHEVSIVEPKQQWTKKYTKKPTNNKKTEQIAVQKRICFRAFQYRSAVCRVVLAFACMFYSVWCRQDFSTCRLALDWRHNRSISNLIRALLWWYQIPWCQYNLRTACFSRRRYINFSVKCKLSPPSDSIRAGAENFSSHIW